MLSSDSTTDPKKVKEAYAQVYSDMDTKNAESRGQDENKSNKTNWLRDSFGADLRTEGVLKNLTDEQKIHDEASLNRNNRSVRDNADQNKEKAKTWIGARVKQITQDIEDLKKQLSAAEAAPLISAPPLLPVINAEGIVVTGDELVANPSKTSAAVLEFGSTNINQRSQEPRPWQCHRSRQRGYLAQCRRRGSRFLDKGWLYQKGSVRVCRHGC